MQLTIHQNIPLADLTSLGVGGVARALVRVGSTAAFKRAIHIGEREFDQWRVLGGMTNIVPCDSGLDGLTIVQEGGGITRSPSDPSVIVADAGVAWDDLVQWSTDRCLFGIELLSGIPGTVGSAPVQNIAAYGQSVAQVIDFVEVYDSVARRGQTFSREDCNFSYRSSRFKTDPANRFLVTAIGVRLRSAKPSGVDKYLDLATELAERRKQGGPLSASERRHATLSVRRRKRMTLDSPKSPRTVGSFFVSPTLDAATAEAVVARVIGDDPDSVRRFFRWYSPDMRSGVRVPAAQILLSTGFRNADSWGPVGLMREHIVAIENLGGATASDVAALATYIRSRVNTMWGINLEIEPRFVGDFSDVEERLPRLVERYERAPSHTPDWVQTHRETFFEVQSGGRDAAPPPVR